MTTVRAKFRVHSVSTDDHAATGVTLHAVYGDGTDNAAWSKATPQGELRMTVTTPEAMRFFKTGFEYYLDFTPVDDADLNTIPGVTVVATEAEVDQPSGPAERWKRAAQAAPAAH